MHRLMILIVLGLAVSVGAAEKPLPSPIVYNRDIRPILADNCWHCHGPDDRHREAKLRLDVRGSALAPLEEGRVAIVPGKPELSELVRRITHADPEQRMPLKSSNKILAPRQIAMLKQWIAEGAEYEEHWSFVAPKKSAIPKVSDAKWVRQPIDAFIAVRLDREGLKPVREADRSTLIRRVALDLTGLPPTPDEVAAFVGDQSGDAYEKMVDRFLASPHYGERMALDWLDASRYGDTSVFHADGPRDMWAWRDGVIRAFNQNQPYRDFSTDQLAGDLIPDATLDQQVASGFNRNNGTTDEGGAIAEEYRVEYAVDRVKTTSMIWLGLTMECAQCHEHKYDPISQTDYYQYYAFFNISSDGGMQTRNGNAEPMVSLPDPEKEAQLPGVRQEISVIDQQMKDREKAAEPEYVAWLKHTESDPALQSSLPMDALAYYPLNEGKDKAVVCSVDEKRKGQFKGKVGWVSGKLGKGLKFDGSSYVDLGDVGNFEQTDAFSYGCWVYPESNSAGAAIARMDDAGGYRGYDLYLSGGTMSAHIIHQWPDNAIKVTSKKKLKLKEWQHVFVTYDGSSKSQGVTLYVNGEKWDWNIEQDGLSESIRTDKPLYLGSRHPGSRFKGQLDEVRLYSRVLSEAEVKSLAGEDVLGPILAKQAVDRSEADQKTLRDHYLHQEDAAYKELLAQHAKLKAREADLSKPLTSVMVMRDMGKPRDTFVLMRGAYDHPSENKVQPGTPSSLPPMPKEAPANRLGLAQWLFRDDHPLTARVTVNRYWNLVFGRGLVSTLEDFGSQGQYPSHPELLDWLAVDFREHGWDVKRLMRQMLRNQLRVSSGFGGYARTLRAGSGQRDAGSRAALPFAGRIHSRSGPRGQRSACADDRRPGREAVSTTGVVE